MKTITINVTQEHIDRGERGDQSGCMVALAAREALPICGIVKVCSYVIALEHVADQSMYCYEGFPIQVVEQIFNFDMGWPVAPFSFEQTVPDWAVAEEPVRSPITASSPEQSHGLTQAERIPDDRHSSRGQSAASSVPVLSLPLSI